jgi:hypothetical protein
VLHKIKTHSSYTKQRHRHKLLGFVLAFTSNVLRSLLLKLSDDGLAYERVAEYSAVIKDLFAGDHSEEGRIMNGDSVHILREVTTR